MISRTLEYDSGEDLNFIGSLALARNQEPAIAPPLKVIGAAIESPLYEDVSRVWSGSGFTWNLHRRVGVPDDDQINRGARQPASNPNQSISISNPLGSGIYRLFFRLRGVCELIPFTRDPTLVFTYQQGQRYKNFAGLGFFVSHSSLRHTIYRPETHIQTLSDPEWFPPYNDPGTAPNFFRAGTFNYGGDLPLNMMQTEGEWEQRGAYYLDRIVEVSAQGPVSGSFLLQVGTTGIGFLGNEEGPTYFAGGTSLDRYFTPGFNAAPPDPSPIASPGQSLSQLLASSLAYYRNDPGTNPARLDTGAPMLTSSDGDPRGDLVGQIQYLGARPDTALRQETITELAEPTLLSAF